MQENLSAPPQIPMGELTDPLALGDGASCSLPKTLPQLSNFQAPGFGYSGLAADPSSFFTVLTLNCIFEHIYMTNNFFQ